MNSSRIAAAAAVLTLLLSVRSNAEHLEKRHQLGLFMGAWNQTTDQRTEIRPAGVLTSVESGGVSGGIFYNHWLRESIALEISISGMVADVSTTTDASGVSSRTSVVSPILMGLKQYFPKSTFGSSMRPYVAVGLGLFMGVESSSDVGSSIETEERTEVAFGSRFGAGVDFILSRYFSTGLAVGFNLMLDFDNSIGGSRNYSGPEMRFGFGYLFGKGAQ